jgi:hypothetical protein
MITEYLTNPPFMYLLTFLSSFIYIFTKSFQQNNVTHRQYAWILPTSMIMATLEVFTVSVLSKHGLGILVLFVGTGGGLGSMAATYLHHKYLIKEK